MYGYPAKMPRPKKSTTDEQVPKAKGLFDHINHIREKQDPNYFESLSEADKKSWSNYMVCRFLSMQPNLVEHINDLQRYSGILSPREFYKVLIRIVPKGRVFYPYVKSKSEKHSKELIKLLSVHFNESERNVLEYISLLTNKDIHTIVKKYGYTDKQLEEFVK